MIRKALFFFLLTLPFSLIAQTKFKVGLYSSNLQLDLDFKYNGHEAYRTHPWRPSLVGIDLQLDIVKGKNQSGLLLQAFTGQYWYTEKPTYARYQGQVIHVVERTVNLHGLGLGYVFQRHVLNLESKKVLLKDLYFMMQVVADFYRLQAPLVKAPYPGMYELELNEINSNAMQVRQFVGINSDWTVRKSSGYFYGGVEFNFDLWQHTFRPNYRFGLGYTFKRADKTG